MTMRGRRAQFSKLFDKSSESVKISENRTMVKNLPQRGFESGRNLRSDIQGLRGIAVLAVLVYHSGLALPGGFVGVDMFFVISGFVITASLLSEYANSGTISIKKFYQRRFTRLFPALALVVVVTTILASFTLSPLGPQQLTASTALAALFSLANVSIALNSGDYFDPATQLNPLLHTWSLSVE